MVSPLRRLARFGIAVVVASSVVAGVVHASMQRPQPDPLALFNPDGEMLRPEGYRRWIYVGSPLTPNDMNDGQAAFPEFHNVYIDPAAFDHYAETGVFRNGTVIIKELVTVGSKEAASGNGYFMGDFIGLEALVKDSRRFRDEPGNWAFFSFGHEYPLAGAAPMRPTEACNACHTSLADDDAVFTQYYPVLRDAKPIGALGSQGN